MNQSVNFSGAFSLLFILMNLLGCTSPSKNDSKFIEASQSSNTRSKKQSAPKEEKRNKARVALEEKAIQKRFANSSGKLLGRPDCSGAVPKPRSMPGKYILNCKNGYLILKAQCPTDKAKDCKTFVIEQDRNPVGTKRGNF